MRYSGDDGSANPSTISGAHRKSSRLNALEKARCIKTVGIKRSEACPFRLRNAALTLLSTARMGHDPLGRTLKVPGRM